MSIKINIIFSINYMHIIIYNNKFGIISHQIFRKQYYNIYFFVMFYNIWLFELGLITFKLNKIK